MSSSHGPFHRRGEPGGPGCNVTSIEVVGKAPGGEPQHCHLLDAGTNASEVELLRTVCAGLGVHWGHDEFGWWAVVPTERPAS